MTEQPITDAERAEWKWLCETATPGPWLVDGLGVRFEHMFPRGTGYKRIALVRSTTNYSAPEIDAINEGNRQFIAASRSALPRLLTENERLLSALRLLLSARDCLAPDGSAEIPEALSASFDIGLDDARAVAAALGAAPEGTTK